MFKKPWKVEQVAPAELLVTDADGHKLFYVVGDQGDEGIPATKLFWSEFHDELLKQLTTRLTQ
jgi:hypothetical protein